MLVEMGYSAYWSIVRHVQYLIRYITWGWTLVTSLMETWDEPVLLMIIYLKNLGIKAAGISLEAGFGSE